MGGLAGSSNKDFEEIEVAAPLSNGDGAISAKKPRIKDSAFSHAAVSRKDKTGTWLSPVEQPPAVPGMVAPEKSAPADQRHKRYIASYAQKLDEIVRENKEHFKRPPEESVRAHGFVAGVQTGSRAVNPEVLKRSLKNCPVHIPIAIEEEEALAGMISNLDKQIVSAALLYTWTERGWIAQGRMKHENIFLLQIRHHSKLDASHDIDRPVFCINLKSFGPDAVDLRVMAIVKSEMPFLEAAAQAFKRAGDAYEGFPVVDHQGRVLIDERIVRRAGYEYSRYQRALEAGELYEESSTMEELARMAHFIVLRSHLPELNYDAERKAFEVQIGLEQGLEV